VTLKPGLSAGFFCAIKLKRQRRGTGRKKVEKLENRVETPGFLFLFTVS